MDSLIDKVKSALPEGSFKYQSCIPSGYYPFALHGGTSLQFATEEDAAQLLSARLGITFVKNCQNGWRYAQVKDPIFVQIGIPPSTPHDPTPCVWLCGRAGAASYTNEPWAN